MKFWGMKLVCAAALSLLSALAISGCGNDSVGPSGNSTSRVRSFDALQGCPTNVDFAQQGVTPASFSNVAYNAAPTAGYQSIRAGNGLSYGVYPTGTLTNPIATSSITLIPHDTSSTNNSGTYTLVAAGTCTGGTTATNPQLLRLLDAFPFTFTGTTNGTVGIRVVNLIPDLNGPITLFSNGAQLVGGSDPMGTNAVPYAGGSSYDGSHYNTGISLTGSPTLTIVSSSNAVLATVPNFTFAPNHAYTLFVTGEVNPVSGGKPITVVPVQDF